MRDKFPSVQLLDIEIRTAKVQRSLAFLQTKIAELATFTDVEDYIYTLVEKPSPSLKAIEHHFAIISNAFSRALWRRSLFIGSSVIDQVLFGELRVNASDGSNAVLRSLRFLKDNGIHKAGMVLYPLHSFGIVGAGFFQHFWKAGIMFDIPEAGLVVRPQTNSLDETIQFMNSAAAVLGLPKKVPVDLVHHYSRSRPTKWLTNNPLLVVKCRSFSGTYYENQTFLVLKLQLATSVLFMIGAFQGGLLLKKEAYLFSSRRVNNWQTLDIHHYFLLERKPRDIKRLDLRAVPMNVSSSELAELSDVNVEINPADLRRRKTIVRKIATAVSDLESGLLRHLTLASPRAKKTVSRRVFRKLFDSLSYFRRSFRRNLHINESIVNLAIAFELLLYDGGRGLIKDTIAKHFGLAARGVPGVRKLKDHVRRLYEARNDAVHSGQVNQNVDIALARQAYVFAFLGICGRLKHLPRHAVQPIEQILNT